MIVLLGTSTRLMETGLRVITRPGQSGQVRSGGLEIPILWERITSGMAMGNPCNMTNIRQKSLELKS